MEGRKSGLRRRNASQSSPRALLACGLVFAFVVVEFWVMHHHAPTHHGGPTQHHYDPVPHVPGGFSTGVGDEHNSPTLPGEPILPDSIGEPSVPAHTRTHTVDQPRSTEAPPETTNNGGGIADVGQPTRLPLVSEGKGVDLGGGLGGSSGDGDGYGDMRVAVLVPYSGPGLPLWFDAFTDLAAASKDLVDWMIFCEEVQQYKLCHDHTLLAARRCIVLSRRPVALPRMLWIPFVRYLQR